MALFVFPCFKERTPQIDLKNCLLFLSMVKEIVDNFPFSSLLQILEILPASITNLHHKLYVPQLQ